MAKKRKQPAKKKRSSKYKKLKKYPKKPAMNSSYAVLKRYDERCSRITEQNNAIKKENTASDKLREKIRKM